MLPLCQTTLQNIYESEREQKYECETEREREREDERERDMATLGFRILLP